MEAAGWKRWVRPQDFVWLLLFSALARVSPYREEVEIGLLLCLGLFQVLEPRLAFFTTRAGQLAAILVKLVLCYLLMGFTGGINSTYYVILLLPVVSAATTMGWLGTTLITLLTSGSYVSFLLFLDWSRYEFGPNAIGDLELRLLMLPVVAFLTFQLADANRRAAQRAQAVAEDLEKANQSLRDAEDAVRRADRLAALGQLTAGLAHELRNPLGTMKASAEMLAKSVGAENKVAGELAGYISEEVDRTNALITRFLEFARPLSLRRSAANVGEVLDAAIRLVERHPSGYSDVTIHKNYSPDIPRAQLDAELMERVFYNVILNACQASPPGSLVTVKTRTVDGVLEVAVIDRGKGIEKQNLESIFNPFFTTRKDGVGLGLAIVSKIVTEHGGGIAVESEPGNGAVFRLLLPLHEKNTVSKP